MSAATVSRLFLVVASSLTFACGAASEAAPAQSEAELTVDAGPDGDAAAADHFLDTRDQQSYATVHFGTKTWFSRNLNFAIAGSSYCYDDLAQHCVEHGRLYSWSVARTACPPGAHLPSDAEWKALETAIGMPSSDLDLEGYSTERGTNEGTKLKATTGFGARMSGFRTGTTYEALGDRTYFWTATTRGSEVWRRRVANAEPTVFRFTNPPQGFAISVRCVVD